MILIERVLFYPAALAATVFVLKLVFDQPSPLTFTALGALGVFWTLVFFKVMFRVVKLFFWLAVVLALGLAVWWRMGAVRRPCSKPKA